MQDALQLSMLEEVRVPDPPIRLSAMFFEPGSAEQVAAEVRALGELVLGVGAPLGPPREGRPHRDCDAQLAQRGVAPQGGSPAIQALAGLLADVPVFSPPDGVADGPVGEGSYHEFPLFETNADGVFCALQGRRLPAKRHPLGVQIRVDELSGDHVIDGAAISGTGGSRSWMPRPARCAPTATRWGTPPGSAIPTRGWWCFRAARSRMRSRARA